MSARDKPPAGTLSTTTEASSQPPAAVIQPTMTLTEDAGDPSPNHVDVDVDAGRHGFSLMAHRVAFLSRLVTQTQPPNNSSDVELGVGEVRERRQSMQSLDERESIHAAEEAEDVPVVALRQRAPTSHQVRNDIMDEVDNETAHYAIVMVRKIEADVSVEELRLDDMNFEEIVFKLNQSQESSRHLFQLRDDEASQCIDINQYPLEVRYKVESTLIPSILNRHGGGGGKSPSLAIKVVSKKSGWYDFVDGGRCMIEFSGSDKEAVKSAYLEVKQFVDYSVRTERPAFVRHLDFHDMLSFSDIEANMLNERLNVRPFFKIRKGTVLFSFGTLRGIIGHSPVKLYLLFGLGDGPRVNPKRGPIDDVSIRDTVGGLQTAIEQITESIFSKSSDHQQPQQQPEFIAYNAILSWTNSAFLGLVADIEGRAANIIEQFKTRGFVVSNDHFEDLQTLSKDLEECGKSLSSHRRCLEDEILNDQTAMAMMSLSYLRCNPSLYKTAESNTFAVLSSTEMLHNSRVVERIFVKAWEKVTGFEMRLERLNKEVEDAHYKVKKADKDVQTTVLVVNTAITVLSTCIGFSGYITGAFGMNLDQTVNFPSPENPIQVQKGNFQNICVATLLNVVLGAPLFLYILVHFHLLPTTFSTKPDGSGGVGAGKSRRFPRLHSLGLSKNKSK